MNINDIYGCIPLDTPVEEICYRAANLASTEVADCNAVLASVIDRLFNSWLPAHHRKYYGCHFTFDAFQPSYRTTGTTDIRLSIIASGYFNTTDPMSAMPDDTFVFLQMHTPYGLSLDSHVAHLVGRIMILKLLFNIKSVGYDGTDDRLITTFIGSTVGTTVQKDMNAQSLEEIILDLNLDGIEV